MNFKHLKYFVATAETGQVSRAAKVLSISQSAVTSSIHELEEILGTSLFIRRAKGMEMTESGRQFLQNAREILEKLEAARRFDRPDTDVSGVITLAASYTVIGYFLPYHLERLQALYPQLEIRVVELNRQSIEHHLIARQIDIAVALTSNIQNPELETLTLLKSPRRLWVSAGHRLATGHKVALSEIAKEPYIMLTVDEAAHTSMKYWNANNTEPRIHLRTSSVEAVRSMVANGQGVTILSDMVYRPWSLEGQRLETVPTEVEIPTMDVGLAFPRHGKLSDAARVVSEYFSNAFLLPKGLMR